MKLRTYSLLLTAFCSLIYIQASAQKEDSSRKLDSMIENTRRDLEIKRLELDELKQKKARLNQDQEDEISETVTAHMEDAGKSVRMGIGSWIRNFNLDAKIDDQVQALKGLNLDVKLNDLLADVNNRSVRSNNDYRNNNVQNDERSKTISKSYPVDKDDKLRINNRYGKVIINTWQKNEIKVDVEMKVRANTENRAQESLDKIHINESKQGSVISFETAFDASIGTNRSGEKREVNYTVFMPASNALEIKNSYGNTSILSDFNGAVVIQQSYGNFTAENLVNSLNNIKASYGEVSIGNLKSGSMDISYGNLKLESSGKLNANISYSPVRIDRVSGDLDLDLRHAGGLKIGKIDPLVKNINIDVSYSSVSLAFDPNANFNFAVAVSYGSFDYDKSRINNLSSLINKQNKMYSGRYGKETENRVNIQAHYGSVKFL